MKKILKVVTIFIVFILIVFGVKNVSANTNDIIGPSCSITNTTRVKLFKTARATLTCYDASGFADSKIEPSDFIISKTIFTRAKVVSVSQPYLSTTNPNFTEWDIEIKGFFLGRETIQLRKNVVSDIFGNKNTYSPSSQIKIVLF